MMKENEWMKNTLFQDLTSQRAQEKLQNRPFYNRTLKGNLHSFHFNIFLFFLFFGGPVLVQHFDTRVPRIKAQ